MIYGDSIWSAPTTPVAKHGEENIAKITGITKVQYAAFGILIGGLLGGIALATVLTVYIQEKSKQGYTSSTTSTSTTTVTTSTTTTVTTETTTTTTTTATSTTSTTTTSTTTTTTTTTTSTTTTSTTSTTTTTTTSTTTTSTTTTTTTSTTSTTTTTTTTTTTSTTTTTAPPTTQIFWGFDNTLQDSYSSFNGVGSNGPTYNSPGYNGAGACLWLNQSLSQSVTIGSPFLNMTYTSFTFEGWLYPNTLYGGNPYVDNAVFGQCDQSILDHTLHVNIRSTTTYLGFFGDDLGGSQLLTTGQWYHLAWVYDYSTQTQLVYVNGYLDGSRGAAGPYQGNAGAITIGTNCINTPNNFFDGCLDSIAYFRRAKNASEILDDATLVAYLSFDSSSLVDSGPLLINGTGMSYSYSLSGRVNTCLTLSSSSSYIQITGLTRLGKNSWPYTVAVWINPSSLSGGTIMHLSSRTDGAQTSAWCLPIMGLTSVGQIAINSWNSVNVPITGPSVPLNSWTHVAATYSSSNGERLFVNGVQYGSSSGAYNFAAGGVPMTLTLGSSLAGTGVCNTGTIQMGQYSGSLDELRVYARELTAAEIFGLANP